LLLPPVQDAMAAGRKVRLVCAFTASLVRARLGDVLPVLVEAQAFCIRFSRNRCAPPGVISLL
jgi:CCR4-NOT transcription complex subunit 11